MSFISSISVAPRIANEFLVLWVFSAAVSALNPPGKNSCQIYGWAYRFLHVLAANLDRAWILGSPTNESVQNPLQPQAKSKAHDF